MNTELSRGARARLAVLSDQGMQNEFRSLHAAAMAPTHSKSRNLARWRLWSSVAAVEQNAAASNLAPEDRLFFSQLLVTIKSWGDPPRFGPEYAPGSTRTAARAARRAANRASWAAAEPERNAALKAAKYERKAAGDG